MKKSSTLAIRFTKSEKLAIKDAAKRSGKKLSDWIRTVLLSKPVNPPTIWIFNEAGGVVKMETSNPLPKQLWERLNKYVVAIKPD